MANTTTLWERIWIDAEPPRSLRDARDMARWWCLDRAARFGVRTAVIGERIQDWAARHDVGPGDGMCIRCGMFEPVGDPDLCFECERELSYAE